MKFKIFLIAFTLLSLTATHNAEAQLFPTNLKVTVLDELGNSVEEAQVNLYKTKEAYLKSENALFSGTTNANGMVKFKKLDATNYFIEVIKADKRNDGLGAETEPLTKGKTNKVNVVIQ